MRHLLFDDTQEEYPLAILVNKINKQGITDAYIEPYGLDDSLIAVLDLYQLPGKKKLPKSERLAYIDSELMPALKNLNTQYVICTDAEYFKVLAKVDKAELYLGYCLPIPDTDYMIIYVPNYEQIFYDPDKVIAKIAQGMGALEAYIEGTYVAPGVTIIKEAHYPKTVSEIAWWLERLLEMECDLTSDIEAFSLKHYSAGIGTIAFAWDQHSGVAFAVDLLPTEAEARQVRALLRSFFERMKKKIIFHNISYDVTVLTYQLYMSDILDQAGLLKGLSIMLKNWHDTKLIAYLATNSCAGNKLGLKDQAQEYAGNYAVEEIKDIRKIPLPQLLQYNLVDCLSTWYVFDKHYDTMVADQQLQIYEEIFQPAILDIVQMQLTGMPLDMAQVLETEIELQKDADDAVTRMISLPLVQNYLAMKNEAWVEWKNSILKKKRVTLEDANVEFNPNSGAQLIEILYTMMGLPILSTTDSGQPETGGDALKALKAHTKNEAYLKFLDALIDYKAVSKILTGFIPAMKDAQQGPDGWYYLFGNFNLGGTVSGRLSSSNPNLQNLPATKSRYAKIIKSCFKAPPGWLFCGIDFNSLEDRISALTTRDPNKLKVYVGHIIYAIDIDGAILHIRDDDTVEYEGKTYSGQEFYETFGSL